MDGSVAAGATCDVGPEGTAWTRADHETGGMMFCWDNPMSDFKEIDYLAGGTSHVYNRNNPPSDAIAYREGLKLTTVQAVAYALEG